MAKQTLKRTIGLFEATLYGIGIILGAGIYALVGAGAATAGSALWLSFLIGAIIAACTGLSYAELASLYPKEAAEYVYTKHAFGKAWLSFMVQWTMVFVTTVSAGVVALGFAGYWSFLFGGSLLLIAFLLLFAMSLLNLLGMKDSARYNDLSSFLEVSGLVGVVVLGAYFIGKTGVVPHLSVSASPFGWGGVMAATTVVYFAFIGFENLVNISEEVKEPRKTIPKALLWSLAISTVIYILVSVAAVSLVGWERLAQSKAPLAEAVEQAIPGSSWVLAVIALFATSNTVLILLIVASRLLYGLASNKALPSFFGFVGARGTPPYAIGSVFLLSSAALFAGGIRDLAHLVDLGIFSVYIFINAAVIALRYREPLAKREFRSPFTVGKLPLLALLGIALNVGMLWFFEPRIFAYGAGLLAAGMVIYALFARWGGMKGKRGRIKR
ncbi:TPA: amino acid permease [Candidatus Woesearchaeota archaeon]|nr:MAG: Amino acid transporter [archaeon GW2011_AR11]QBM01139.1 hypothetical protein [uncultured archaeon]HIH91763.1 amino acid permease [Candidatus Woesearchaeota archaeon]HII64753.1 amino acid permease [Candidatus Woesearchaeota archaeon]HIJ19000.1 amino acid permease [Candidatus Woesearchaeota archaeon]